MIVPILLLVAGLAAGAVYLSTRPPTGPSGVVMLPPELQADYFTMLNSPGGNPPALDFVASELDRYGFSTEAMNTRARAAQIRSVTA